MTRAEVAINTHTDSQVLELRTTAETSRKCEVFLQSLKAPRMNQRYNDVMDSRDASFKQVFATYEEMIDMYREASEESGYSTDDDDSGDDDNPEDDANTSNNSHDSADVDSEGNGSSEAGSHFSDLSDMNDIFLSWDSLNMWLQSTDKFFYIQGKPGSGKSTLVKFILNQDQTKELIQRWSPDAIIISYFFWKIGAEEQNSIKGLWCSLLYKRLQDQQPLISSTLEHFSHFSSHSEYHDWSIKELQEVWGHVSKLDTRHICIFIDGLDEVRNEDGFSKLAQSIHLISQLRRTKLCVSARPEAQIVRWLRTTNATGILLEDLTRFDMLQFVRGRFYQLLPNSQVSLERSQELRRQLVAKAQGVFLWLHLATRSIIEGIENSDSENMLFARLNSLPGDLQNLYIDLWQRMNAKSPIYVETARRYFRYVLQDPGYPIFVGVGPDWRRYSKPWLIQIACADNFEMKEKILKSKGKVGPTEILQRCEETKAAIQSRCAGLLEVRPEKDYPHFFGRLGDNGNAFGKVAFIHRTAHDFLTDTEAGQSILGHGLFSGLSTETELLNGLICTAIIVASEWPLSFTDYFIIKEITDFAKRWGSESLLLATEMLDMVRPLYDRKRIRPGDDLRIPSEPFFSQLTTDDLFDEFVISRLATETSPAPATSVLREGWALQSHIIQFRRLSKRLFFALITIGASPHEYGIPYSPKSFPFAAKETAFTNLLTSFIISTKGRFGYREDADDELHQRKSLEILEIALHMATTYQNLDKVVSLFAYIDGAGPLRILPLEQIVYRLGGTRLRLAFVVLEVNIQFLMLYIIYKVGVDLANSVLTSLRGQDVLSRVNSPLVKMRYIQLPEAKDGHYGQYYPYQRTFQRIISRESLSRSDIERLFDMDFGTRSHGLFVPLFKYEERQDLAIITRYAKDKETEEVGVEDMMTSLATENLGFCTCEEAGITPPYEYLRRERENNTLSWRLFPLAMARLESAAAASTRYTV